MAAKEKVVIRRIDAVSIEAVQNGYRVKVAGNSQDAGTYIIRYDTGTITFSGGGAADSDAGSKKKKPPVRYEQAAGEYVFPDFATLTAWLRKNVKHGGGVTP